MTTRLLRPQVGYSRILMSDGAELSHTNGVLNVAGSFSVGNLQVNDSDVGEANPVHVALVSPTTIAVTDDGGSITVDASALDIRALSSGTDSVSVVPQSNLATLYNNGLTGADSSALDKQNCKDVSFVGTVSGAVTFDIKVGQDGTNYFNSGTQIVVGGAGSFHANFKTMFRYVRLSPSVSVTATVLGSCM
jgi:hypothetical protein